MDSKWDGRLLADARQIPLADESVQMCVTSPPYWNLRKYDVQYGVPIGNEPTVEEWLESIRTVFREVFRVLKSDGTLWLNLGDAYANDSKWGGRSGNKNYTSDEANCGRGRTHSGLKDKNLIGMPWMVAFALRSDGWYLRQEIIWHKTQAMPESVKDRPTRSHEQLFLLSKSERYFYDGDAIKEPASPTTHDRYKRAYAGYTPPGQHPHQGIAGPRQNANKSADADEDLIKANDRFYKSPSKRVEMVNKRSVWSFGTAAYSGAHYACFPQALVEPCVLAGSRPGDIVFDPFFGSGTTGVVAERFNRRWIGCDLGYQDLQANRMKNVQKVLIT